MTFAQCTCAGCRGSYTTEAFRLRALIDRREGIEIRKCKACDTLVAAPEVPLRHPLRINSLSLA